MAEGPAQPGDVPVVQRFRDAVRCAPRLCCVVSGRHRSVVPCAQVQRPAELPRLRLGVQRRPEGQRELHQVLPPTRHPHLEPVAEQHPTPAAARSVRRVRAGVRAQERRPRRVEDAERLLAEVRDARRLDVRARPVVDRVTSVDAAVEPGPPLRRVRRELQTARDVVAALALRVVRATRARAVRRPSDRACRARQVRVVPVV